MNIDSTAKRPTLNPLRSFMALLRRELLQHRGALLYTPLIIGVITLVLATMGLITGEGFQIHVGKGAPSPQTIIALIGDESMLPKRVMFFNSLYFGTLTVFHVCMFVVVLLYCLGALYEERKDRSILFWKSMPVSDTRTIMSKLATATLTAPAIMLSIMAVTYVLLLCLLSITVWRHGGSAWDVVWRAASPFSMSARSVWLELVNGLWLLPIFGWLLFCSSFAKSRPFLWAFMVPFWLIAIGKWITSTTFASMHLDTVANWLILRLSAGVTPLGPGIRPDQLRPQQIVDMDVSGLTQSLFSVSMWIGIGIGAGLIAAAIYWRRYRDDSI